MGEYRKKLIEVALPLAAINKEAAREKSIRHGHPSTLHLWWARRPLAACRAVLFASLVDDPDSDPAYRRLDGSVNEERAGIKRAELFNLIEELVKWENSNNPGVINKARAEIASCVASRMIERDELNKEAIIFGREEGKTHPDGPLPNDGRYTAWQVNCRLASAEAVNYFLAEHAPPVLDPFCGGGSIPLEAQRLGLRAHASDLNPVPVLITKALIEIPPKFAGLPPVHPGAQASRLQSADGTSALPGFRFWQGAAGLAEDVRYYGQWMREEAQKRIGHLYPKVKITQAMIDDGRDDLKPYLGKELIVIAWLWARTVASPDPSVQGKHVPLVRSFWLSKKKGREAYVRPIIDREQATYEFKVNVGKPTDGFDPNDGIVNRRGGRCIVSGTPMSFPHIRKEGKSNGLGVKLMAIVAEGNRGRVYLSPDSHQAGTAVIEKPIDFPNADLPDNPRDFKTPNYGLRTFADLFTPRQLTALTTFSDLVKEARERVLADALGARASRPHSPIHNRGYLPHWEAGERPQSVTFRLADSLPKTLLDSWQDELARLPEKQQKSERRRRIEDALDAGHGANHLREPRIASIVEDALQHFDGTRYRLHAWSIMPNHVHVLFTPMYGNSLSSILHSWKSFTAKEANKVLQTQGSFWQEEYFDRMIRNDEHFMHAVRYIEENPVKAGLCTTPEAWERGHLARKNKGWEEMRARRPRSQDDRPLADGGIGPQAYADAVATYLAFALDKCCDYWSTIATWATGGFIRGTFARQALPMTWDFAECNPMSNSTANWMAATEWVSTVIQDMGDHFHGIVKQIDATSDAAYSGEIISTDPPYYDNIGYADLSDFFYIWLRRFLHGVYPSLLSTMLTPKAEELIASPYRHNGSKQKAAEFFETGLGSAIGKWREHGHQDYPTTIFYAFKQAETDSSGTASTGWETFLTGVIEHGFTITGTWPIRTERSVRSVAIGTNALASSVVLVCVPRSGNAPLATRREFLNALKRELPDALRNLQSGNIAPVDLAQAAIGPGMAIFSRYAKVVEADGEPMRVRAALTLINQVLDEVLAEQEGEFDADTRWAVAWFEQYGMEKGDYGVAETLSKAKNTSVQGLVEAGVVSSRSGVVQLLGRDLLPDDWDPTSDGRLTEWEAVQHLIRALDQQGEMGAADLLRKLGNDYGERARDLSYRLYSICERKGWASEAIAYNSLILAWSEISKLARQTPASTGEQRDLFE